MKYLLQTLTLSAIALIAVSCNEDDTTQADDKGQVAFTMKGANSSNPSGRVMNDLEITSATAAVSKVELESENESDSSDTDTEQEIEFEGQYVVDLMTGISDPAFGTAEVAASNYNEIEIEFGTFLADNASLIIEGNYVNNSGETVPFKYTLNKKLEIEIESNNQFEVKAGSLKEVVAQIDFSLLFQNIDFELAETNADGLVIINASLNTYVYNLISQNFDAAIEVEVEED